MNSRQKSSKFSASLSESMRRKKLNDFHPNIQNNNQFYNNQTYLQIVYAQNANEPAAPLHNQMNALLEAQHDDAASGIHNKRNSKFIKIPRKDYEQDRLNLTNSHLEKKYFSSFVNHNYPNQIDDDEEGEDQYIYLYKENLAEDELSKSKKMIVERANSANTNDLHNQLNALRRENFLLTQRINQLNVEVIRLQKLNLQYAMFPSFDNVHSHQYEYQKIINSNKTSGQVVRLPPIIQHNFNIDEYVDNVIKEISNYK